ncbi:MAG TPA: hypothetical protein VHD61_10085 [Lacunisphaera sp.]|nr:hypothetical protein [Lacunisphaera sp.]
MKLSRRLAAALALACFLAPVTQADDRLLVDFADYHQERDGPPSRPYEYAYQDWERAVHPLPGKGTLVQAPSGKGGLGENKPAADFGGLRAVEIFLVIGGANQARQLGFGLVDKDGTDWGWNLSLEGKPRGAVLAFRLDLAKPDYENQPGKTKGINLDKLASWQVRGDFSAPAVEVLLLRMSGLK